DNISGVASVLNKIVGKRLAPNQAQPRWILEGLAVLEESAHSSGGRIRSSLFDTYLRADILDGTFAGLDAISNNAQRWPQGTLWYLYGARFLHWIAEVYGEDVLRAVAVDYGSTLVPLGINRAIRRQTGKTYEELYEGFRAHLEESYRKQLREVSRRGLREGRRITFDGREALYPVFVPQAALPAETRTPTIAYFRNDLVGRPGVYTLELPTEAERREPVLLARTVNESPFAFGPDGSLTFSSTVPYRNVYYRSDLFRLPPGTRAPDGREAHRRALTSAMRASAPTVSPDGRTLVFTVNARGTTALHSASVEPDGSLGPTRVLVPPTQRYDQAYTPTFSPDGTKLAWSRWTAGGFRDVAVLDLATRAVTAVTHDRAIDQNPAWSPDGRWLYFSSDRTGIFNVYAHDLESGALHQVTNVRTAALMPAVSPDGKSLVYVGYTSKGHDLHVIPLDASRFLPALSPPETRPEPREEPPKVAYRKRPYRPLETLRPRSYGIDFGQGNFGQSALTFDIGGADIAGHHAFAARVVADFGAPVPQVSVGYDYTRMPFDVGVQVGNRVAPRNGYRIGGQTPTYVEQSANVRTSLSYRRPGEFAVQSFGISYTASLLDAALPVANVPFDPLGEVTVLPRRGFLGIVHVGYGVGRVEGALDTPGPVRGFSLAVGVDVSDESTGSSESLYEASYTASAYLPLPWAKNQVLALRSAGGLAAGSYSRRGLYYVGGYNLANTGVLDTVTSGIYNGAFVLRGYPAGAYSGSAYTLQTAELRFPIAVPDRGLSTLPLFLRRIDGNLYLDYGGAFDDFDARSVRFLSNGALINSPQLHTGIGGELWFGSTVGYLFDVNMRLGYAYGMGAGRIPGGQLYFLAAS
ncbi:MAG: PD40 domain-containing protein, partial [Deltaproteobacteria bacterium]|nr:PD40 domain-containing protein [Deltaproteobacteria bacterium]